MKELSRNQIYFIVYFIFVMTGCTGFTLNEALAQNLKVDITGNVKIRHDKTFDTPPTRMIYLANATYDLPDSKWRANAFVQQGHIWKNQIIGISYNVIPGVYMGIGGGISTHRNHILTNGNKREGIKRVFENGEEYTTKPALAGFLSARWKSLELNGNIDHSENTYRYSGYLSVHCDELVEMRLEATRSLGVGICLVANILPYVQAKFGGTKSTDIYQTNYVFGINISSFKRPSFIKV